MSSDDADDERDSARMTPVAEWANPKSLQFTVFVVMPSEEVCTVRELPSGITVLNLKVSEEVCTVRELPSGITVLNLKARLELHAGVPSQIYQLVYPDGEEITDDQQLLVSENILDGYVLKMQLLDNWDSLYIAITRNNIEHVYHSGGVHLKGNIVISADESERYDGVVRERGTVSLFLASFLGLHRMVRMLLSVGVNVNSSTQFARTALHAAVSKDHVAVLDLLLNHGASLRHVDSFGRTALDIAKTVSPSLCAKRLRLMQLNLRGMTTNGHSSAARSAPQTNKTNFHQTQIETLDVNKHPGKSDYSDKVALTLEIGRTRSSMSPRFEISAVSKSVSSEPILHKNRKHISASASAVGAFKTSSYYGKHSAPSPRATSVKVLNPKRVVKWKDVPTENAYWHVIEFANKQNNDGVVDAVNIQPVAIIQQKKILKFSGGKAGTTSTDPTQTDVKHITEQHESTTKSKSVRFTEAKLRYYERLSNSPDDTRSMRRKINIVSKQGQGDEKPKMSEAFKNWLEKKDNEREKAEERERNLSDTEHVSDCEEDKMKDFNKRVRKQNRENTRCLTPGNRPVKDIVELGSTVVGDPSNPPAYTNITAHRNWKRSRIASGHLPMRNKQLTDFMEGRKMLEEKRQKLLMSAISYDEWMDHAEERKFIIQQILQADMKEMQRLEEEKFVGRFRMHSFDEWKQTIKKREQVEKKKREIKRKYEQELAFDRVRMGKSGSAKPFEDWVQKKREDREKEKEMTRQRKIQEQAEGSVPPDSQEAYEQWFWHKTERERKQAESKVLKDRELLGVLRQMRTATVAS